MPGLFAEAAADEACIVRRIDARTKVALVLLAAVLSISASGLASQLVLFAATLAYALLLRRSLLLAVLYSIMAAMMAIASLCGLAMGMIIPAMGGISVRSLVIPFLRGLSMMNVVMALALSTRVEDLMATLERIRLPFCVFLPTTVMLRFIPTFTGDIRQVWETLRIRGWPLGPVMLTLHPVLSSRLVLAPILFRALKSSEALGVASELKGLGTSRRTVRSDMRSMSRLDAVFLALAAILSAAVILCEVYLRNVFPGTAPAMP